MTELQWAKFLNCHVWEVEGKIAAFQLWLQHKARARIQENQDESKNVGKHLQTKTIL
jgi:hypothetical protein